MKIIIDCREHDVYAKIEPFLSQKKGEIELISQVLHIGDILLQNKDGKDILIFERKTLQVLSISKCQWITHT